MTTFRNLPEVSFEVRERAVAMLEAASWTGAVISLRRSGSFQSCSTYVEVSFTDADGDYLVNEDGDTDFTLRFSDHADRHRSDVTFRIDHIAEEIEDEDGDFDHFEVADEQITDTATRAVEAARAFFLKLGSN